MLDWAMDGEALTSPSEREQYEGTANLAVAA
jgi:hypothetical protein